MVAIARGASSSAANPVLSFHTAVAGLLAAPSTLEFQVFDISDETKRSTPVQVFPAMAGTRHTVNLTSDLVSLGRYAAAWTVGGSEPLGTHEVRWFWTMTGGTEQRARREFDVLVGVAGFGQVGYALLSDLRAEGFDAATISDARLQQLIERASRSVERFTGRFFEPRPMSIALDGWAHPMLALGQPLIALDSITTNPGGDVALDTVRPYCRHLSEGLLDPDDRDAPALELWPCGRWPRGRQNITVRGVFGYTDPDGSAEGTTPELIRRVTALIVAKDASKLSTPEERFDARERHRLTSERTREQSYTLGGRADLSGSGDEFTGDPEIDEILAQYSRPVRLGAV